ncbi:MAG: N-acetylmuramoyl-L-alanine amidase [Minwuia thermotolerans]|nr:MAG: N-acetylmuramoyl-L-alanine amidase [Minwuia thermotolerans]
MVRRNPCRKAPLALMKMGRNVSGSGPRRRFSGYPWLWLAMLFVLLLAPLSETRATAITAIRTGENAATTRVVLDLSAKPEWNLFLLEDPFRIVVDLADTDWALEGRPDPPRGLIRDLRFGQFRANTGRLVMDADQPVVAHRVFALPPQAGQQWRLVIDLRAADGAAFAAAKQESAAAKPVAEKQDVAFWPSGVPPLPPRRPGAGRVVVIDPGHGGVDPGAIGAGGTREKDIVLSVGLALREALRARGNYRIVMTRDGDRFVRLGDRVRIARRANADLFVSLHADAAAGRTARGAGVYTLSEKSSDREAAALARRENRSDIIAGVDLSDEADDVTSILIDLAQRETMNQSATLAQTVVVELGQRVTMRSNPHRFAGFRVLKAPDVPSVLVEIGFLTNRQEEAQLKSSRTRQRIADGLADAIDAYFRR